MLTAQVSEVSALLDANHYLGAARRGFALVDRSGCLVFANPNSRRVPQDRWVELIRWCILEGVGSQQWAQAVSALRRSHPHVTTVVSYSDPGAEHDGALYRASAWRWAPTWHRLRPPPSGNGDWGTGAQHVKDRWVFCLRPDDERADLLALRDEALRRKYPWAEYREPKWKRGVPSGGGGDYKRAVAEGLISATGILS